MLPWRDEAPPTGRANACATLGRAAADACFLGATRRRRQAVLMHARPRGWRDEALPTGPSIDRVPFSTSGRDARGGARMLACMLWYVDSEWDDTPEDSIIAALGQRRQHTRRWTYVTTTTLRHAWRLKKVSLAPGDGCPAWSLVRLQHGRWLWDVERAPVSAARHPFPSSV